jgi:curved DNA-binding protein CbpA
MTSAPNSPGGTYYRRLEVGPAASHDEIVHAYRRLALGVHPDAHPEDPEATRRFQEITEAYNVLADPEQREAYDRTTGGFGRISVDLQAPAQDQTRGDPPVYLGRPAVHLAPAVPLRAGPVQAADGAQVGAPTRSALFAALAQILDSWRQP